MMEKSTAKNPLFHRLHVWSWLRHCWRNCLFMCAPLGPNRPRQRGDFGSARKRPSKPARMFGSETRPPMQVASSRFTTSDANAGGDSIVELIVIFARRCKIHAHSMAREFIACK